MSDKLTWDAVYEEAETVTEEEIKQAEESNKPPVGKYIVVVKESTPKQINPKAKEGEQPKPSYFNANLKLEIEQVVEIDKKPVNGDEADKWIGRIIWDGIRMFQTGEDDMWKNRRIRVAKAAGVLSGSSTQIPKNMWSELIIGKRFLIDHEANPDKKTGKVYMQVGLFGYHAPEDAIKVSASDIEDI
jgi:hypothetical protein